MAYGGGQNNNYGGGYQDNPYAQQNQYGQQQAGGYGRPGGNPYAQGGNPYAQGGNPYAQQNPFAQQDAPPAQPAGGYGRTNDMEMGLMNGYGQNSSSGGNNREILDECRRINAGIQELENTIQNVRRVQNDSIRESGENTQINRSLDQMNSDVLAQNKQLINQIKRVKGTPGAANPKNAQQVKLTEEKLTRTFQEYQTVEMDYRRKFKDQLRRQYLIVNPNADESQIQEAIQDPQGGVFAQALIQSDRRGQAQSTLRAVESRHQAIQQVERQMMELAELFTQMNQMVLEQEHTVTTIAQQSEQVHTDLGGANEQLDGAIVKAKARNRKKWWCLGISILIIIIIIVVVVAVIKLQQAGNSGH